MKKLIVLFIFLTSLIFAKTNDPYKGQVGFFKTIYLKDGNILYGSIVKTTEDNKIVFKTDEGLLTIPINEILEETVRVEKKDGSVRFGKLIGENELKIKLETKYGEVSINKSDVETLERFFGGKSMETIQKKKFFKADEDVVEIGARFPTAFILNPYTFYITGFSMGYGFNERLQMFSKITNNFDQDVNLQMKFVLKEKRVGAVRSLISVQTEIFSNHKIWKEYAKYYDEGAFNKIRFKDEEDVFSEMYKDQRKFYGKLSIIHSKRMPLASGRGNWSYHLGGEVNSLIFEKPNDEYYNEDTGELIKFTGGFSKNRFQAYDFFAGMDYDLHKKIKFVSVVFYDPGNHYLQFGHSIASYFNNGFIPNPLDGERKEFDFDFGIIYAASESLRFGFHFQSPYLTLYWKIRG